MLTQKILAGIILAGLAGVVLIAGDATAQSGSQSGKLRICQQECAGNQACLRTCAGSVTKQRIKIPLRRPDPDPEPEPPAVKSWQEEVFGRGVGGAGGGGGGGGR
jgi:hypothetical protein